MRIRDYLLLFGGVAAVLCITLSAKAQECVPYDVAIKNLASNGWTVHPDILLGDGYEADRLIVGSFDGFAFAMPVVKGCVVPVQPLPIGPVRDKGTPA